MTTFLIVPGLGNSGEEHWQTYFEKNLNNCHRIQQQEWDAPVCTDWVNTIEKEVSKYDPNTVILIGHSLSCATIAHWAAKYHRSIKGALLVAPSDLEAPQYTFPCVGFAPIPLQPLGFKSIVVASNNDAWVLLERAKFFADSWGSDFINIGDAGHINAASGHGEWRQGIDFLKPLVLNNLQINY